MRSHRKWLSGWTTALVLLFSVVELATDAFAQYYGKLVRNITALHQREDGNGDFLIGHCNGNCEPDLYFIKRRNTDTKSIEVHCLSQLEIYQKFTVHTGTPLAPEEDSNGDFLIGDCNGDGRPDLYFIKRRNTDTKSIEVHCLDGASNFQKFIVHTGTPLAQREDGNGDFQMSDQNADGRDDLYFIKRRNTDTKSIEVHCLDGASNFQKFIVHTGTPLAQREDGNGDFRMCMSSRGTFYPAVLFFIKRRNTDTKSIEVHSLFGPDFQKFRVQTGTQIPQSEDGNGDFQMGLYDGPANVFFIKRRNTDSKMIEVHILRSSWTK
jgi:hypothetical protein